MDTIFGMIDQCMELHNMQSKQNWQHLHSENANYRISHNRVFVATFCNDNATCTALKVCIHHHQTFPHDMHVCSESYYSTF